MVLINLSREDWSREVRGGALQIILIHGIIAGGTESSMGKEVSTAAATCKIGRTCAYLKEAVKK